MPSQYFIGVDIGTAGTKAKQIQGCISQRDSTLHRLHLGRQGANSDGEDGRKAVEIVLAAMVSSSP